MKKLIYFFLLLISATSFAQPYASRPGNAQQLIIRDDGWQFPNYFGLPVRDSANWYPGYSNTLWIKKGDTTLKFTDPKTGLTSTLPDSAKVAQTRDSAKRYTDFVTVGIASGFKGSVTPVDSPTLNGIYTPSVNGTYTKMGGYVITLDSGYVYITKNGSIYTKTVIPINLSGYALNGGSTKTLKQVDDSLKAVYGYKSSIRQLNIFDKSIAVDGRVLQAGTGANVPNTGGQWSSFQTLDATKTYIANLSYTGTATPRIWYYDARKTAISFQDFTSSGSKVLVIPDQAMFWAITTKASSVVWQNKDSLLIEEYGSPTGTYPSSYSAFNTTGTGKVLYAGDEVLKKDQTPPVQYVASKDVGGVAYVYDTTAPVFTTRQLNIFDKSKEVTGFYIDAVTGGAIANATGSWSGFQLIPDTTVPYYFSGLSFSVVNNIKIWYYNYKKVPIGSQTFISGDVPKMIIPSKAAYFAFTLSRDAATWQDKNVLMIEQWGTTDGHYPTSSYSSFGTIGNGKRDKRLSNYFDYRYDNLADRLPPIPPNPSGTVSIDISPNQFSGTDIQKIRQAVALASISSNSQRRVVIGYNDSLNRPLWLIDSAILVPANVTIIVRDTKIKNSDISRDNWFRSANVGLGKFNPVTPQANVKILGEGMAVLEGADNPRSTGDYAKTISLSPTGNQTYGSDAGVSGQTQTGDWRNIGILMGNVNNVEIAGLTIVEPHCWGMSFEYCTGIKVHDITIKTSGTISVGGVSKRTRNKDGIDLRAGCQNYEVYNINATTDDDIVAQTGIIDGAFTGGAYGYTLVMGGVARGSGLDDIAYGNVHDIKGTSAENMVRFLNGTGVNSHDHQVRNILDNSPKGAAKRAAAAVVVGSTSVSNTLGSTYNFIIDNVISRAGDTTTTGGTIDIIGTLSEAIINNVIRTDNPGCTGCPNGGVISYPTNPALYRNINTTNIYNYTAP
ncbi:hypothetical protein F0919_17840 [Taibaiella lutea]|uniref:Uncharacterized protein n=1 Tax=Taibaiella lutea TaxID=2608001 RepID=A0A5M6CCC5_9BACT|nr:glycosyl hydrolase family 28 protein [Taibaiella lutea]KAA5532643.1 hypothetical protein F0919_17840 [Taibaiella lutea]